MDIALARSELKHLPMAACTMIIGAVRTTSTKVLEVLLDLPTLGTTVESAALMAVYRLPRPDPRNPGRGIGYNRIQARADKVGSYLSMIKDCVTLLHTFSKYRIVIPTK